MKFIILALLFLVALSLPYQAHGFNDLEYFVQLLKKGVRTFKMDLSLLSKKSCLEKSSWKQTDNTCFTLPAYAQQLCCLGFRGDTSSTPQVRYQFNTTKQFLAVLARPDLQIILREKIFLAINFQYVDSQNPITKQFLYDVLSAIKLRNLSITLATGTDNVILDYDYKCVIQGKCDEKEKFISDSNIVLQSSSENPFHPHDVKKRYRNFNVFYKSVEHFCKVGFPAWVDKYDYPLIFWEPSSEEQIQFVLNTFLSSDCKRPAKHNTIKELAIASNLEPEVFQVFALGKGRDFGLGERIEIENAADPLLTTLEVNGVKQVLLGYNDLGSKTYKVDLLNSSNPKQRLNSFSLSDASIRTMKGSEDTFAAFVELKNGSKYYRIYNSSLQQIGEYGASDFYPIAYYKQIIYSVFNTTGGYKRFTIDVLNSKSSSLDCAVSFLPTDATYLDTLYFVGSQDGYTYLNKNCESTSLKLSYGLDAKITSGDNQLYIFQTGGICQSAVLMNNNEMNKCDFFSDPEFKSLTNVPYMTTYIAGTVENIYSELNNRTNWVPLSGCSQSVYSAKIGNGDKVSPIALNGRLHFAQKYIPVSKQPFITTVFCGGSNFDNRNSEVVVVASFDAPPLTKSAGSGEILVEE